MRYCPSRRTMFSDTPDFLEKMMILSLEYSEHQDDEEEEEAKV